MDEYIPGIEYKNECYNLVKKFIKNKKNNKKKIPYNSIYSFFKKNKNLSYNDETIIIHAHIIHHSNICNHEIKYENGEELFYSHDVIKSCNGYNVVKGGVQKIDNKLVKDPCCIKRFSYCLRLIDLFYPNFTIYNSVCVCLGERQIF